MSKLRWTTGLVLLLTAWLRWHIFKIPLVCSPSFFKVCLWRSWTTISVVCSSLFLQWPLLLYSRSSWQATIHPTIHPSWQTKVLISLIMNQYAAGSPSREDFTEWMHLFSTSTARDEWRDGGENKDISDAVQEANGVEEKWMFLEVCF